MTKRRLRRARSYPRRQYRRFRRGKAPIPILPVIGGVVAPMADAFSRVGGMATLQGNPAYFVKAMTDQVCQKYTGFSPFASEFGHESFNLSWMLPTYGGLLAGIAGHMIATKLGVNRAMRRIPLVGKYVAL